MTVGTVRLSDIVVDAQSGFACGESTPDGVLQVRMNNVTTDGAWNWHKERRVPTTPKQRDKCALELGDVLVNVTNSPNLVGKTACFPGRAETVVFSNHFVRLRLDRKQAEPEYVRRWLNVQWQRHIFEGLCTQWVNQASVRKEDLLALPVPLPPLPEQRRIAAILDKADAVRRKRQQTLDLADQFLRSAFLDMFGDPVTNPKRWPPRRLGDVGELDRGRSQHRPRNAPELLGGPYPLIQTGDVANSGGVIRGYTQTYSEAGLEQSRIWKAGTLCITIAANIANTAVLAFDACFPDSVVGFAPGSLVTTEYVQGWFGFLQPVLERRAPQVAQKNINLRILRGLDILIPPTELQTRYAIAVARVRGQRQLLAEHSAGLDQLVSVLGQRAFRGELTNGRYQPPLRLP